MKNRTNTTCPVWCEREHPLDLTGVQLLSHDVDVSSRQTDEGTVTISLVFNQRLDAALSDPPYVAFRAQRPGTEPAAVRLTPEQADALAEALYVADAPMWLVDDLARASTVIAPHRAKEVSALS